MPGKTRCVTYILAIEDRNTVADPLENILKIEINYPEPSRMISMPSILCLFKGVIIKVFLPNTILFLLLLLLLLFIPSSTLSLTNFQFYWHCKLA